VAVTEGVVAGRGDPYYLEAGVDAHLVPPGRSPPTSDAETAGECGNIELSLDTETRELRLSNLSLPTEAQTGGLGSLLIRELAVLAEALGLESMHLEAGNVGRWAWMRCGFDFDDPIWRERTVQAANDFAAALSRDVDLSAIEHAWDFVELPGVVSADEIRSAGGHTIRSAGQPIALGKALILGPAPALNPWWGRLRLGPDSEGRVRLDEYVASREVSD
jgi:hypothetical protein